MKNEPERALFTISQEEGVRVRASVMVGARFGIESTTRVDRVMHNVLLVPPPATDGNPEKKPLG